MTNPMASDLQEKHLGFRALSFCLWALASEKLELRRSVGFHSVRSENKYLSKAQRMYWQVSDHLQGSAKDFSIKTP